MRILFVKTDALGDQLWATGTLCALLEREPAAQVVWLVRAGNEAVHALLEGSSVFRADQDQLPAREAARLAARPAPAAPALWSRVTFVPLPLNPYAPHPPERNYLDDTAWWMDFVHALQADCAIAGSVSSNWADQALAFASASKTRVGYEMGRHGQPVPGEIIELLQSRGLHPDFTDVLPFVTARHEGENLAKLIEPITGQPGHAEIRLHPGRLPGAHHPPDAAIVLAPGANDPARIYPPQRLAEAIAQLAVSDDLKDSSFLLLQGPKDAAVCSQLAQELAKRNLRAQIIAIDPADPRQAAGILAAARLLVCNESFWVHLASAVGTPTVAIWGLGHWGRFTPRQGHVTVLHMEMLCQQCHWLCCFPERHCITDIPVGAIVAAAHDRLHPDGRNRGVSFVALGSPRSPVSIREALYLQARSAEHARRETTRTVPPAAHEGIPCSDTVRLYVPDARGRYTEAGSMRRPIPADRHETVFFRLERFPHHHPLRLDPVARPGKIEITSILCLEAGSGQVLCRFDGADVARLTTAGDAQFLPPSSPEAASARPSIHLLSTGNDPQLLLPAFPEAPRFPLLVLVDLRFIPS